MWSFSCEVLQKQDNRSFPIVEHDVIYIIKYPRLFEGAQFCIWVASTHPDLDVGVMGLEVLPAFEGRIEVARKRHRKSN